jgi:gliding motility-associated-like protein
MGKIRNTISIFLFAFASANAAPLVDFTFQSVCENTQMPLTATFNPINDSIVAYDWDFDNDTQFDDGSGSIGFHTFLGNGNFIVGLRMISIMGDTSSFYKTVTVLPIPKADFSIKDVCVFSKVSPKDSSAANGSIIQNYFWTFDSSLYPDSLTTLPSWTFDTSGIYNVELKLRTADGCIALVKKNVNVYPQPVSDFSSSSNCLGDTSVFTENVKIASGYIVKYQWDFNGDKIYDDGVGESSKYGYFSTGHELVGLRTISDKGCIHDTIKTLSVYPKPRASFITNPSCENQPVVFSNLSATSVSTLKYQWSFGNGDTSTAFEPDYAFPDKGTYIVKLLVVNFFGCIDSIERNHAVKAKPIADFSYTNVCFGQLSSFTDASQSADKIESRIWDFNDGNGEVASQPKHLYATAGTYNVFLRVETENGCIDTMLKSVEVYPLPVVSVWAPTVEICKGDSARLEGIDLTGKTFIWSTASTDPVIYVTKQDDYQLTVFDANNCSVVKSASITVNSTPTYTHTSDTSLSLGSSLQLWANGALDFSWSDQSGVISQSPVLNITPENSTQYIVKGTNDKGCSTSYSVNVNVSKDYNLAPNNLITPNNDGKNDNWTITNIAGYNDCKVIIFNRWGQAVFHSAKGYNNDWNGKDDNGNELPDGGYFYIIQCDGLTKDLTGPITILRSKE